MQLPSKYGLQLFWTGQQKKIMTPQHMMVLSRRMKSGM
jgi:hypothetical protein